MATANDMKERLEGRLDKGGDCWLWRGCKNASGYGVLSFKNKTYLAHRASWLSFRGQIPERKSVLHHCDTPACCNPAHLWLGDQADNMRDMFRKRRRPPAVGERNGLAVLTEDEVRSIRASDASLVHLAKLFGVAPNTVKAVRSRRTWRHVQEVRFGYSQ